jgi:hypothetical protein
MAAIRLSLREVVDAIENLNVHQRVELSTLAPAELRLTPNEYGWLKVSESSFAFWVDDTDIVHDQPHERFPAMIELIRNC